jgi:hypothetical protein
VDKVVGPHRVRRHRSASRTAMSAWKPRSNFDILKRNWSLTNDADGFVILRILSNAHLSDRHYGLVDFAKLRATFVPYDTAPNASRRTVS